MSLPAIFKFRVAANLPVTKTKSLIGDMEEIDISGGLTEDYIWKLNDNDDVTGLCSDPEGLSITYILSLNKEEITRYPNNLPPARMLYTDSQLKNLISLNTDTEGKTYF